MTVQNILQLKKFGLSTDQKPSAKIQTGSPVLYEEQDTGKTYILKEDNVWEMQTQTKRTDKGNEKMFASSHITILPKNIPKLSKFAIWKLDGNLSEIDTSPRDLVSAISPFYLIGGNYPFNGHKYALLYLSTHEINLPLSNLLRGSSDFMIGGWFNLLEKGHAETLFFYGHNLTDNYLKVQFDSDDNILLELKDGTTTHTIKKPALKIRDKNWHYVGVFHNAAKKTIEFLVSNGTEELEIYEKILLTSTLSSMDDNRNKLCIGWEDNTTKNTFHGGVANFQVYNNYNSNSIPLLLHNIKESPSLPDNSNTHTVIESSSVRFNEYIKLTFSTAQSFINIPFFSDDGKFDVSILTHLSSSGRSCYVYLDNVNIGLINTTTIANNNFLEKLGEHNLSRGFHILKIVATGSTGILNLGPIQITKTHDNTLSENGGANFLLTGESVTDYSMSAYKIKNTIQSGPFGTTFGHSDTAVAKDGDYMKLDVFCDRGAYAVDMHHVVGIGQGIVDVYLDDELINSVDCYNLKTGVLSKTYHLAFEGSRHTFMFVSNKKNTSATNQKINLYGVTAKITNGESNDNNTWSLMSDKTIQTNANPPVYTQFSANVPFASFLRMGHGVKLQERLYFAGGLYKYLIRIGGNSSAKNITISIDGNTIQTVAGRAHADYEGIIKIKRGFHVVKYTQNGNVSDYVLPTAVLFTGLAKIANDKKLLRIKDKKIPLATYVPLFSLQTYLKLDTFVSDKKFEKIIIELVGNNDGSPSSRMQLNINDNAAKTGKTVGVYTDSAKSSTTVTNVAVVEVMPFELITSGAAVYENFTSILNLYFAENSRAKNCYGTLHSFSSQTVNGNYSFSIKGDFTSIKKLEFSSTTNGALEPGHIINVYGVLR